MQQPRGHHGDFLSVPGQSNAQSSVTQASSALTSGYPSAISASSVSPSSAVTGEDTAENWPQFEILLSNCCDRVHRHIDARFKTLAEHLWEDIDHNCATPELIESAFNENFVQIDDYLNEQFTLAKQQLDRVLANEKPYRRGKDTDDPGGAPTHRSSLSSGSGPSEPFPTAVPARRRSEPKPPDRPPPDREPPEPQRPSHPAYLEAPSLLSYMKTPSQRTIAPAASGRTSLPSALTSVSSEPVLSHITIPRHETYPVPQPSYVPSQQQPPSEAGPFTRPSRTSAPERSKRSLPAELAAGDYAPTESRLPPDFLEPKPAWREEEYRGPQGYREPRPAPQCPAPKSLTSLVPRVTGTTSLVMLGIGIGILATFIILYLSPYLPVCVRQYLPYHANQMWSRSANIPSCTSRTEASIAHRNKPYDAFWSSCGNSFGEWWSFVKHLFFY